MCIRDSVNTDEVAAAITKLALKNLTLISCDSPWEFAISLHRIQDLLKNSKTSRARLIIIDSISTFYFLEKQLSLDNRRNFDDFQSLWCRAIDKLVREFGATVIATKLALLYQSAKATPSGDSRFIESMSPSWCRLVTHKFEVSDGKLTLLVRDKHKFSLSCELQMEIVGDGMAYLRSNTSKHG